MTKEVVFLPPVRNSSADPVRVAVPVAGRWAVIHLWLRYSGDAELASSAVEPDLWDSPEAYMRWLAGAWPAEPDPLCEPYRTLRHEAAGGASRPTE